MLLHRLGLVWSIRFGAAKSQKLGVNWGFLEYTDYLAKYNYLKRIIKDNGADGVVTALRHIFNDDQARLIIGENDLPLPPDMIVYDEVHTAHKEAPQSDDEIIEISLPAAKRRRMH